MKYLKILTSIALASALLSGCAGYSSDDSAAATLESYNAAVADAKSSLKTAASANYEWRDSGKILKKAEKAAKAGDFETAIKLVNKAKHQGDLALAQSKEQAHATPH